MLYLSAEQCWLEFEAQKNQEAQYGHKVITGYNTVGQLLFAQDKQVVDLDEAFSMMEVAIADEIWYDHIESGDADEEEYLKTFKHLEEEQLDTMELIPHNKDVTYYNSESWRNKPQPVVSQLHDRITELLEK